jgi:hypothetical protein
MELVQGLELVSDRVNVLSPPHVVQPETPSVRPVRPPPLMSQHVSNSDNNILLHDATILNYSAEIRLQLYSKSIWPVERLKQWPLT